MFHLPDTSEGCKANCAKIIAKMISIERERVIEELKKRITMLKDRQAVFQDFQGEAEINQ